MERRLAAILAADVQGYSHLTELNEEGSTATLRMYRAVVEESIAAHKGHIFSSAGDGVVAEFPSIIEAIRCAVEIQNEIAERNASVPENERMQFRIGVNLGDVVAEENNLYGTGVNVAVRLEQLAEPGGIFLSQTVYDQVRKIVELPFEDVGERRLKNIADPVHVYRIPPSPLPWLKKVLSPAGIRQSFGAAAGVALLLLAVAAGAFYLRQPAALWNALLGEASLAEHAAIAVLPFNDMSPTHDQQYLADGITEELTTGLAKFPELIVMSRNATLTYKDKPTDTRQVGKDLNVRYLIEGSVQRADQNVRVTAQLIDASTGRQLWADGYDREISSIFAIRDDITRSIVGTLGGLGGKLARAEVARVSAKNPNSFTAYDYLMRGWYEWHKFTRESNAAARDLFEQSRKIDPNYARAYAGLAWAHADDYDYEWTQDFEKTLKLTLEMAQTAVRLDPNDYQAQWALGWACLYNRQYEQAMAHYLRARELNPNDAELLAEMANFLIWIGQPKQAVDQVKEAIRLNPFHENWYEQYLGWAYEEAGMPQKAIEIFEQAIDLQNPDDDGLWYFPFIAAAYADPTVGRMDDARGIVKTLLSRKPEFSISEALSHAYPYKTKELVDRFVNAARRAGVPVIQPDVAEQSPRP
jgi:TolB-like protein/class 3 adenylate cyclase/tetratricopeptide (TPR) repeat protein